MYIRGILICIYVALVNNEKVLLEQTILNIIYIYIYIYIIFKRRLDIKAH